MGAERGLFRRVPALRAHLVVCAAAAVATAIVVVVQAETLASGLSRLVDGDTAAVAPLAWALVAIGAVRGAARWVTDRSGVRAVEATRTQITATVIERLDALDAPGWAATKPANLTALCTSGVDALEPWIRGYLPALCLAAVVPITAGIRILVADVLAAVILAVAIPLIPVFMILIGRMTDDRSRRQWATLQRLGAHFHDVLVGLETLRLFGRAEAQVARVRDVTEQYRRAVLGTLKVAFLSALVLELLSTLSVALVAVSTGVRLADARISLYTALVVLLLAPECSLPIRRVGAAYHAAVAGTDAATELDGLDALSAIPDGPLAPSPGTVVISSLVVEDMTRGHRVGPVDLTVRPGEVVALCGPTGSGKSTVLAAIAGTVPITSGHLEIGGAPIEQWSREARRSAVVTVPQHPRALGATVADSVALGNGSVAPDRVTSALAGVDLDGLAHRRPDELSGGERQRLAVARAVLAVEARPARVVLADEPTAHLDRARSDLVVDALMRCASAGAAVVVVTHDPAVAARADRVIELAGTPGTHATPTPTSQPAPIAHVDARPVPEAVPGDGAVRAVDAPGGGRFADLRWLGRMAPSGRGRLSGARALGVAAEACAVGLAATSAWLILRAAQHPSFEDLALVAVAVRAFALGKGALRYAERLASHDATLHQLGEIRAVVVERLGRLVPAGLPHTGRGDLLAAVVDDVDRLADLELRVVGPAVSASVVAIGTVVALALVIAPAAAVLAAGIVVVGLVVPGWVARRGSATGAEMVAAKAEVGSLLVDLAERADEIASLGATSGCAEPVVAASGRVARLEAARGRTAAVASGLVAAAGPWVAAGTVAVVGAATAGRSGPLVGVAVLVPFAVIELFVPAVPGAELASTVAASAARLRALLGREDPTPDPAVVVARGDTADLELDGVTLGWPGSEPVLTDVDLRLAEGRRLAVRGPSGSGKSTLAAGLVGFLRPSEGTYLLGGVDSTTLGGRSVREVVTWCGQEPWLADTSIRENLRIAAPEATDATLTDALSLVRLSDWVAAMPAGLDTLLGPDAVTASGGERQRLALARILLAGHRVVVLDEPTAHLDPPTAEAVMGDLVAAFAGRSLVVIGHAEVHMAVDATVEVTHGHLG